jgi:hypothetical protein
MFLLYAGVRHYCMWKYNLLVGRLPILIPKRYLSYSPPPPPFYMRFFKRKCLVFRPTPSRATHECNRILSARVIISSELIRSSSWIQTVMPPAIKSPSSVYIYLCVEPLLISLLRFQLPSSSSSAQHWYNDQIAVGNQMKNSFSPSTKKKKKEVIIISHSYPRLL